MNKKLHGFTLAEVLITLGIIGVVAAMTMPTLLNKTRNKELETGLKRANTLLSQAFIMYQAENGEPITNLGLLRDPLKSLLMKYLKNIRDCGYGSGDGLNACIPRYEDFEDGQSIYKTFNGLSDISSQRFDDGQFILNDGTLILLEAPNMNINGNIYISVDVNGFQKRPNRLGQDLFMFQLSKQGVLRPMGTEGTTYYSETDEYCSLTSTNNMNGAGCTYKALTDSDFWKNLP